MSTNISNHFSLSKVRDLLFARQTPQVEAERHQTLTGAFKTWRARQNARAELMNLSDRELADIGILRSQIADVVARTK
jgi:uncharacterized protein YjiS (DUF1127 family)